MLGENEQRLRYQEKRSTENKNQGPAASVTLRSERKQGDIMKILRCECGREQAYGRPNHITIKEAESLGWVLVNQAKWVCPVCNEALAMHDIEIVAQDNRGNKASIGKYKTSVDNYVLCVDVSNRDMSNVLTLQIEFFGKSNKMKKCPRCNQLTLKNVPALNSLSRRGSIYICNPCGDEEALIDIGKIQPTEIEKRFVKKLSKL